MTGTLRAAQAAALIALAACQTSPDPAALSSSATVVARVARLDSARAGPAAAPGDSTPLAQWTMPRHLAEISGLALTPDGRLLVHNDELGEVWEIDYRRGVLVKRFSLGTSPLTGDFEGITMAGDTVFMITGKGKLYEFREGANGAHVEYKVHDPGLEKECAFEGVAFDPTINAMLLACKIVLNKALKDSLVIFRWNPKGGAGMPASRLTVPLATIIGTNGWKNVQPSDISIDPITGNYVLIASVSDEKALMQITPAGAVVSVRTLPARHHQPEGLAITKDSILLVSDEAAKLSAMITLYRWP